MHTCIRASLVAICYSQSWCAGGVYVCGINLTNETLPYIMYIIVAYMHIYNIMYLYIFILCIIGFVETLRGHIDNYSPPSVITNSDLVKAFLDHT